jgi:hypothetical protein
MRSFVAYAFAMGECAYTTTKALQEQLATLVIRPLEFAKQLAREQEDCPLYRRAVRANYQYVTLTNRLPLLRRKYKQAFSFRGVERVKENMSFGYEDDAS